jgi:membrane protease YdiL (CAAX protease family)
MPFDRATGTNWRILELTALAKKSTDSAKIPQHHDYWCEARRPLNSLIFLAPLLAAYEFGVVWLGGRSPDAIRNGADHWMRSWLDQAGLGQAIILPALIAGGLFAWHLWARHPWKLSFDTFAGMGAESLLFALLLVVVGQCQEFAFRSAAELQLLSLREDPQTLRVVTYLGAGIYEEVMFRLCLLPLLYALFRGTRLSHRWSAGLAIVASSLTFSLAHYIGPSADSFEMFTFTFRALAGSFFAGLFVLRGFGITVGCHAAYDVLVGVLLAAQH